MRNAILGVGAILAAAIALAGCGGSGSAGGTAGTTGGVAGVSTTKTSTTVHGTTRGGSNFNAHATALATKIRKSVDAFAKGNLAAAASSGASLLSSCKPTVSRQLAPHATTGAQRETVKDLRLACGDLQKADKQGMSGNMSGAKNWARQAAHYAQLAGRDTR